METRSSKKRKMESPEVKNTLSTSLLDLPMETLIYLGKFLELKHIYKFRCYSRYSREVGNAMLSDLRELVNFHRFPKNDMQLRVILKQCHSLRKIRILKSGDKDIFTNKIIENLLINNPLLEEVELWFSGNTGITSKTLIPLATKCKKLTKLIIRGFYPGDEFWDTLGAHNNHLVELRFDFYVKSQDQMEKFWELLKNQSKLQFIGLPDKLIVSLSIDEIYEKILLTIIELCKELTHLGNLRAKIHTLHKIVENCPKLNSIDFAYNERVTGEMLSYLESKNIQVSGGCSESELDYDLDNGECYCFDHSPPRPQYYDPDRD